MGLVNREASTGAATEALVAGLYDLNRQLQVPSPKGYGIPEDRYLEAIPTMAAQALASGSPQNNPRVPTSDEIATLYREVWA
jgi:alcohol dehydrogenase class IV